MENPFALALEHARAGRWEDAFDALPAPSNFKKIPAEKHVEQAYLEMSVIQARSLSSLMRSPLGYGPRAEDLRRLALQAFEELAAGKTQISMDIEAMRSIVANGMPPTLAQLNEDDDPRAFSGTRLGEDGQGNELWKFGERVANRREYDSDDEGPAPKRIVEWTNNIAGWNYNPDTDGLMDA